MVLMDSAISKTKFIDPFSRYSKMWHKGISFTSESSALVYLVVSFRDFVACNVTQSTK